jgi:hypothetical protein
MPQGNERLTFVYTCSFSLIMLLGNVIVETEPNYILKTFLKLCMSIFNL